MCNISVHVYNMLLYMKIYISLVKIQWLELEDRIMISVTDSVHIAYIYQFTSHSMNYYNDSILMIEYNKAACFYCCAYEVL